MFIDYITLLCCSFLAVHLAYPFEMYSVQQATRNILKFFFHLQIYCYHRQCSYFAQMFVFAPGFVFIAL